MIPDVFQQIYFQNSLFDYSLSLALFSLGIIVIKLFDHFFLRHLRKRAEKTKTKADDFFLLAARKNLLPVLYFGAFYLCTKNLVIGPFWARIIDTLGVAIPALFGASFFSSAFLFFLEAYWQQKEKDSAKTFALKWIGRLISIAVWGLAVILFLDNIGVELTALIAGLGIGGIAIAFAAQALLGDFFSFFTILFDRPFEVGDFIEVGDLMGTVQNIGLKTTRLQSLSGEELIFSNTDLTNSRVKNYKRMTSRRILFKIGVTYDTSTDHLKEIPEIIKNIIASVNGAIFNRAHFFSFGDYSLVFEVVYYVADSDYGKYMDIQQEINFRLKEEFDKKGIRIALPTQTLYLSRTGS